MKLKLITILLLLATSVGTMFAWDYEHVQIGDLYYNLNASGKTAAVVPQGETYEEITSGNNYLGLTSVTIPASVEYNDETYNVTEIGYMAFYHCSTLTSVTLPEGITGIHEYAFSCTGLTQIVIPASVISIHGSYPFEVCASLASIIVTNGNSKYDSRNNCNAIIETSTNTLIVGCKNTNIPSSVTTIGQQSFYGASGLTSITIPNGVTNVGYRSFDACSSLASITLGSTVKNIGNRAFTLCSNITSIYNYAATPQIIESEVFSGSLNKSLCTLYVPEESVNLYQAADIWKDFGNIVGVESPAQQPIVERVQIGDLYYNLNPSNHTAEVTYKPNEGKYTGNIVIPSYVEYETVGYSVTGIGSQAFSNCTELTGIEIPNSVTEIGYYACSGSGLVNVTIPASVINIDLRLFSQCYSLLSINIESENPNYSSIDGVMFNKDQTTIYIYPCGKQGSYTIPDGVIRIGGVTFGHCSGLTGITIPNTVAIIEGYSFMDCTGLTSVAIPSSVTDFDARAFQGCANLASLVVDENNLNYCSIEGVVYSKDRTKLIRYPNAKQSVFTIPNHVTVIGESSFGSCSNLTSITIPNTVTTIEAGAFTSCGNITSLTIPNSVTSIAPHAFVWCGGLSTVTIPSSVTEIGQWAFRGCESMTYIINYATTPQANAPIFKDEPEDSPTVNFAECRLYVPEASVDLYRAADSWKDFEHILSINDFFNPDDPQNPGSYRLTLVAEPEEMGTVSGAGLYAQNAEVEISAIPNTGHHFVNWSDENISATRTVTISRDTTFTANFAVNYYSITFENYNGEILQQTDVAFGTLPVYEGATPVRADSALYTFTFHGWNPEVEIVSGVTVYTAEYDSVFLGEDTVIVNTQADIAELPAGTNTHIIIEQAGQLVVSEPVNIQSLTLHMGSQNAQVSNLANLTVEEADLVLHMPENAISGQWFAFAVPFKVSVAAGIHKEGSTEPVISGMHFVIDKYDGALRASDQNGWQRLTPTDSLYPGQLYMIAAYETPKAWRFTAAQPISLAELTSLNVLAYPSLLGDHHAGWNAISNTLWTNASAELEGVDYITTYNNQYGAYEVSLMSEYTLRAAEPFFVQTPDNGSVTLSKQSSSPSFAPLRMALSTSESAVYTLGLTEVKSGYTDKAYMTLNEEKEDAYVIGRDLEKMQRNGSAVPQLWTEAYDMRLAAQEVAYSDSIANVSLGLYAPVAGSYRLEIQGVPDQTSVLLTLNGDFVSTLSISTIDLNLTEGDNTGYGLCICNVSKTPTAIGEINAKVDATKILRDGQLFIIRGEKVYTLQGQEVK